MTDKPRLGFFALLNMSFGFFGIQFGWGLQMANNEMAKTGSADTFEGAARMLNDALKKQASPPTQYDGLVAAGTRAAENVGFAWATRRQSELADISERAEKAGVKLSLRNLILFKIKELEGQVDWTDKAMHFAGEVFAQPFYEVRAQNVLNRYMGQSDIPNPFTMFNTKEQFVRFMQSLDVTEQAALIDALSKEAVGMGQSTPATIGPDFIPLVCSCVAFMGYSFVNNRNFLCPFILNLTASIG